MCSFGSPQGGETRQFYKLLKLTPFCLDFNKLWKCVGAWVIVWCTRNREVQWLLTPRLHNQWVTFLSEYICFVGQFFFKLAFCNENQSGLCYLQCIMVGVSYFCIRDFNCIVYNIWRSKRL